jgi:DNA-binding LacI/PurR family transcriptional regulator
MSDFKRQRLHDQVAETMRKDLAQFAPGQKLESDDAFAQRYSVSLSVVRRALALLAREGSITRKRHVGSFVSEKFARLQAGARRIAITLDTDPSSGSTSFFYVRLMQHLRRIMAANNLRTSLYTGDIAASDAPAPQTCKDFVADLLADSLSGILSASDHTFGRSWFDAAVQRNLPMVGTTGGYPYSVEIVTRPMYEEVARLLILQGRRDVSLLQWALPWQNPNDEPKEQPFLSMAATYGVNVRPNWIVNQPYPDQQAGWHGFKTLWNANPDKPNAVFIADDLLFPSAAAAIMDLGIKVPEELIVITDANRGSGMVFPFQVTSVVYDPCECAELMGDMMIKLLHKQEVMPRHIQLPYRIVNVEEVPSKI